MVHLLTNAREADKLEKNVQAKKYRDANRSVVSTIKVLTRRNQRSIRKCGSIDDL